MPPPVAAPVLSSEALADLREQWSAAGLRVVLTNGCFDLLHAGHVRYLRAARALGDRLVVALNDDTSTRALKGEGRPVLALEERAELLAALRVVDAVVPFGGPTAEEVVRVVRPDVYAKGGDYGPTDNRPPEADVAAALGAEVVFLPYVAGRSTTDIIAHVRRTVQGREPSAGDPPVEEAPDEGTRGDDAERGDVHNGRSRDGGDADHAA